MLIKTLVNCPTCSKNRKWHEPEETHQSLHIDTQKTLWRFDYTGNVNSVWPQLFTKSLWTFQFVCGAFWIISHGAFFFCLFFDCDDSDPRLKTFHLYQQILVSKSFLHGIACWFLCSSWELKKKPKERTKRCNYVILSPSPSSVRFGSGSLQVTLWSSSWFVSHLALMCYMFIRFVLVVLNFNHCHANISNLNSFL